MTSLGSLLQQMKEREEHDLAYAKKIKEIETQLKVEQETLKELKFKKGMLSEEVKRKTLRYSEKEITQVMLQHKKKICEDLLLEAQGDLRETETKLDELQQSVCLNRLTFCNDVKDFLAKNESIRASNTYNNRSSLPLTNAIIKVEPEENEYETLMEEMMTLENELEELKAEGIQVEELKKKKVELDAEPTSGEEFIRHQKLLKETKENLKKAEEEVASLKMEVARKDLLLLQRRSNVGGHKAGCGSQSTEDIQAGSRQLIKTIDDAKHVDQVIPSTSKSVTFNTAVETKTISPPLQNEVKQRSKNRNKSPSAALRKRLSQQVSSKLDERMRDILFNKNS